MALRVVGEKLSGGSNPAVQLYRHITKQIPRVLTLYDINMEPSVARQAIQNLFRENAHVQDPRVIDMLVTKANMEMEETLMQWKQKTHLLTLLEGALPDPKCATMSESEQRLERFFANMETEDDEDV